MDTAELDYHLPDSAIAQSPIEPRDAARLLVATVDAVSHRTVAELDQLLDPGDVLVVNDTRVIPARLHLRKPTGGAVEVLVLHREPDGSWEALVRPGRRVPPGTVLHSAHDEGGGSISVTVGEVLGDGRRSVRLTVPGGETAAEAAPSTDHDWLERFGEVPLPPYIHEPLHDTDRYQTVFAARPGSVAAPTAGLHLTDAVLDRCRTKGVTVAHVELEVGLGTFRPITTTRVEDHPMHPERYRVPPVTVDLLAPRLSRRPDGATAGRVVAVGTTVVRALESWAATGRSEDDTELFIRGDHRFAVVDRLLTNFHVPRSSLLALVDAFVGPRWRSLYATALAEGYRFLSFGDAMLLDRSDRREGARP